ncbi:MAG TPA: GNAT family N-acetyltransferase [Anaerolineaceae bacterium]|jgi:ribosomal-protein-alanine N-acetyltransferase
MQPYSSPALENRLVIEQATWRDLNAVRAVERACFDDDAWPLFDLIAALTFPDVVRLKAVLDGQMVGFAGGDIRHNQKLGWITTLGVLPEFRRMGIASALLEASEEALGQPRVRLCVRRSNTGAIRLYDKYGYQQVGVWPSYYEDREDAFVMEKNITVIKEKT